MKRKFLGWWKATIYRNNKGWIILYIFTHFQTYTVLYQKYHILHYYFVPYFPPKLFQRWQKGILNGKLLLEKSKPVFFSPMFCCENSQIGIAKWQILFLKWQMGILKWQVAFWKWQNLPFRAAWVQSEAHSSYIQYITVTLFVFYINN